MPAISVTEVSKSYRKTKALDEVSITVNKGDVYGFLGPNGAGKTTMIRIILGLLKKDGGRINILDEHVDGKVDSVLGRIGSVLAPPSFYPHLSGKTNLEIFSLSDHNGGSPVEILERVGLSDAADRHFSDYSAGMKQRLAIAVALMKDPELYILDEPTSGLDPQGRIEIRKIIDRIGSTGKTVFLSTHMLNEVQQVCNRVGVLKNGKRIAEDEVPKLLGDEGRVFIQVGKSEKERAGEVLEKAENVTGVTIGEEYVELTVCGGSNNDLIQRLIDAGLEIVEIRKSQRDLEDVFMELTGEGE